MSDTVNVKCACGSIKGSLEIVQKDFFHVHCLCCDCQDFAKQLKNEQNILNAHGGSELLQTYPSYLKISEGQDHIGCMQLKPKGLFRWYATCCNTPLANTMTSANVPFVGISIKFLQFENEEEKLKVLGPVTIKAFGKHSIGPMQKDTHARFPLSSMPKLLSFMAKGFFKKRYIPSPFFENKKPIA